MFKLRLHTASHFKRLKISCVEPHLLRGRLGPYVRKNVRIIWVND